MRRDLGAVERFVRHVPPVDGPTLAHFVGFNDGTYRPSHDIKDLVIKLLTRPLL